MPATKSIKKADVTDAPIRYEVFTAEGEKFSSFGTPEKAIEWLNKQLEDCTDDETENLVKANGPMLETLEPGLANQFYTAVEALKEAIQNPIEDATPSNDDEPKEVEPAPIVKAQPEDTDGEGDEEAPENEGKAEKFKRLANARVNKALKYIDLTKNLATPSAYEFNDEQVAAIISLLRSEVDDLERSFQKSIKKTPKLELA